MKDRQTLPFVIFRRVYRLNNTRNEITVLWHGNYASLHMNMRTRKERRFMRISNLTTDRRFAIFVAEKICSLKVSGLHFYDVISDNLDEFADSFEAIARQL